MCPRKFCTSRSFRFLFARVGKSTLLSLACGLLKPEAGTIRLFDQPPKISSQQRSRWQHTIPIGYMFQQDHLFEWRTLYQNVMLGPELYHQQTPEVIGQVKQMLEFYGLKDFTSSPPSALSGGMRQRAALIRTLALDPADDITTLIRKSGKTVLMVTHDLSEAVSIADRILVLSGRPCTVKAEIPVVFPDHITSPGMRRQHPYFSDLFKHVWKELKRNDGAN